MDSAYRRFENWSKWGDVSPEVRRMIREVRKESLLYHDRQGTRDCYYSELIREMELLWKHIVEDKTRLLPDIKPREIYRLTRHALGAFNLESVRKPVKFVTEAADENEVTVGRALKLYLYDLYSSSDPQYVLIEGINEGHEGKKKGLLKDGDTIEINSGLPGGIVRYKVKIVPDTESFASNFTNDIRLELPDSDSCIFGKKDAEGKPISDLVGKDEFGWLKYSIRKIREKTPEDQRGHRFGSIN